MGARKLRAMPTDRAHMARRDRLQPVSCHDSALPFPRLAFRRFPFFGAYVEIAEIAPFAER